MLIKIPKRFAGQKIINSRNIYDLMKAVMVKRKHFDKDKEQFYTIGLHTTNIPKYVELASVGTIKATLVDARSVFRQSIHLNAVGIILAHNHPSGNFNPSETDIQLTKNLVAAGKLLEIPILDHIIVTTVWYYSFADEGML